jgi:hypothetical protein
MYLMVPLSSTRMKYTNVMKRETEMETGVHSTTEISGVNLTCVIVIVPTRHDSCDATAFTLSPHHTWTRYLSQAWAKVLRLNMHT